MVKKIRLNENFRLEIKTEQNGWAKVKLVQKEESIVLGAEMENIFFNRLKKALVEFHTMPAAGVADGLSVVLILTLMEEYMTIYIGEKENRKFLFFENSEGELIKKVEIDFDNMMKYLNSLS